MKRKRDWFKLVFCVSFTSCIINANSEVRITEIMTNNVATVIGDTYNYDGYVEFYNDGSNIDLKGWTVTNMKKDETNWSVTLESEHVIPNGYSLLFFGKKETTSSSAKSVKSNYIGSIAYKLSTDEGSILFEKDGNKIELSYPNQYPHISYCKEGFMMPTPGKENDNLVTTISNRVESPKFKTGTPGIYDNALSVELECKTEGAKIYYTLNGDIPTPETGTSYTGPIEINATTSLRAKAFKDGMLYSEILTGSFILPDKFHKTCTNSSRLPVVCITANDKDIYDGMQGIYVEGYNGIENSCTSAANYNQDWMRSANFEYILDGKVVDNQEVEIGVYGGCTRVYVGKSLKIKANKRSGKNKMNYDSFFTTRSYKKYKSLALRNGGNGYSYITPRWRDMFMQSLADGMNIDKQAAQPVAYYLNGKYYGMMILTERTDEDYIYHNYGLDEDEIDLLSVNGSYDCEAGTRDAFDKLLNYVKKYYSNDDFYDKLDAQIDIDEYIDYQIIEQFVANTDWVVNNIKLWRKHDGGKFRWILFDTDFGLSPRSSSVETNMIDFTTKKIKTQSNTALALMLSCMSNEDFRWRFLDQYLDRLENQFTDEKIDTKLDSIYELTEYEMCATIHNSELLECPGDIDVHHQEIETMRSFAKQRKNIIINQLKSEYGLGNDLVDIKVRAVFPDGEDPNYKFLFNKREFSGIKYNTTRYSNERVKIEPIIPAGYKLLRWLINDEIVRTDNGNKYMEKYLTTVAKSGELKISVYFEKDPDFVVPTDLCLNEICASNETYLAENGEAPDWIELYNGGDKDVDIAGMTIENKTKGAKCVIPASKGETVVPAHGYKLLWADKNTDLGPLHLNFKLGATVSEKLSLSTEYLGQMVELSSITYVPLNTDESYGRRTDGDSIMTVFKKCTDDDGKEFNTSTPLAKNGSIVCSDYESVNQENAEDNEKHVFVEGSNIYVQNAKGNDVRIYSLLGNVVANKTADSNMFSITIPTPGIYLVKVDSRCWKIVVQ